MVLRQNSNSLMMCCIDMDVLRCSCMSCSSLCLMMVMAGSTGTDVKRVFTSYDVIHSPCPSMMYLIWSTKFWMFLMWCGECPSTGLMMLTSSLAIPYMTALLLDTMGIWGCPFCVLQVAHRIWRPAPFG